MFEKQSLPGTVKKIGAVAGVMSQEPEFADVTEDQVSAP